MDNLDIDDVMKSCIVERFNMSGYEFMYRFWHDMNEIMKRYGVKEIKPVIGTDKEVLIKNNEGDVLIQGLHFIGDFELMNKRESEYKINLKV